MYQVRKILPVVILSLLFLSGCGKEAADQNTADTTEQGSTEAAAAETGKQTVPAADVEKGLLRVGIDEPVETMDVHKSTATYSVPLNIFERLFDIRLNEDGSTELVPGLAEEYSLSEDSKVYNISLRDNAFFSDGTPVKASDVAFTFTRMLALPESVQRDFADLILGADRVISGESETLEGIEVLDDTHLRITLSEPSAGYIYQTAAPSCSILSEKCVREAGDEFGKVPEKTIGSGPYMVTEYSKTGLHFELNPFYQLEKPSAEKVDLQVMSPAHMDQAFREGRLDILDTSFVNPETVYSVYMSDAWKDQVVSMTCVETQYIMLNLNFRPLDDVRVRKAVQRAVNRPKLLEELYYGQGVLIDGIYPRGLFGFSEENQGWLTYDPEEAKRLLEEIDLEDIPRIELAASSTAGTRDLMLLDMVRQDLEAVGLPSSIVSYDADSRMYLRNEGKLMAYSGVWMADYNDPDNFIYTFFGSREKTLRRSGNYADEKVFQRISDARTISDEEARFAEYAALEKLLVQDEAVWIPLFSTSHLYVRGSRVREFTPYWAGWSSMAFKDVVLDE